MRTNLLGLVVLLALGGLAAGEPARFHGGSSMRIVVRGQHVSSLGLRPGSDGWRLPVDAAVGDVAEVVDVTDGAAANKWLLPIVDGALRFDERFSADHAYRVTLRRGMKPLGSTLVYLHPRAAGKQKVKFDADERPGRDGDDPVVTPKPSL